MSDHQFDPESDSLSFPNDTIVGIVDDPDQVSDVIDALTGNGVTEDHISVLSGKAGARRLDPQAKRHGLMGEIQRVVQHFGDQEASHVRRQAEELENGNFLIAAKCEEEERDRIAGILRAHGGRFINHYGTWTVTRLED
jgi:hypothetical protein